MMSWRWVGWCFPMLALGCGSSERNRTHDGWQSSAGEASASAGEASASAGEASASAGEASASTGGSSGESGGSPGLGGRTAGGGGSHGGSDANGSLAGEAGAASECQVGSACDGNEAECQEGSVRASDAACGINTRGHVEEACLLGRWQLTSRCDDPDQCADGTYRAGSTVCGLNGRGRIEQVCQTGSWQQGANCRDSADACQDPV
jgi:hypothetical protein